MCHALCVRTTVRTAPQHRSISNTRAQEQHAHAHAHAHARTHTHTHTHTHHTHTHMRTHKHTHTHTHKHTFMHTQDEEKVLKPGSAKHAAFMVLKARKGCPEGLTAEQILEASQVGWPKPHICRVGQNHTHVG